MLCLLCDDSRANFFIHDATDNPVIVYGTIVARDTYSLAARPGLAGTNKACNASSDY